MVGIGLLRSALTGEENEVLDVRRNTAQVVRSKTHSGWTPWHETDMRYHGRKITDSLTMRETMRGVRKADMSMCVLHK